MVRPVCLAMFFKRPLLRWDNIVCNTLDSKVQGASMGPIWGRQDPGGPHVGPMNFAIWDGLRV